MNKKSSSLGFSDFDSSEPKKQGPVYIKECAAHGCPCSVFQGALNQGIKVCEYHENVAPKYWPRVTQSLQDYAELVDLADRLQRDWKLIDVYNRSPERTLASLDKFFEAYGAPELKPQRGIVSCEIDGVPYVRNESAYDLANRIKAWVRSHSIGAFMLENSKEQREERGDMEPLSSIISRYRKNMKTRYVPPAKAEETAIEEVPF